MEVDYILSCALELGEITALEESVLRRHPAAFGALDSLLQERREFPTHFLQNTARDTLTKASQLEQYFFALCSIGALRWSMDAIRQRAEHLVQSRLQNDLGLRDNLLIDLFEELGQVRLTPKVTREEDIGEGVVRDLLEEMFAPAMTRSVSDLTLLREALQWYHADNGETFGRMVRGARVPASKPARLDVAADITQQRMRRREKAQQRTVMSRAKAAVKKATKLFQNLGQESNLKLFVSGSEVTLSHPQSPFKLVVKPLEVEGWLLDRTQHGRAHTPYELMLLTKEDVFLTKLCVYFQDTPVLDQLLALTFYVQSGEELQILQKANWYANSAWDDEKSELVRQAYPSLESKLPKLSEADAPKKKFPSPIDREEAHWAPFKGRVEQWVLTWFEPVALELEPLLPLLEAPLHQLRQAPAPLPLAA